MFLSLDLAAGLGNPDAIATSLTGKEQTLLQSQDP
jgi:hypothetical protein